MKDTKRTFPYFKFYDRNGMQTYLEKMAEKGWLLNWATEFGWHFRRIEPTKLHFSVIYFPKESMFTSGVSENLSRFHEFCAHTGWKLASSNAQVQFFYNEAENPVPIETDAVLEVANIHNSVKKRLLPGYCTELLVVLLNQVLLTMLCKNDPISYLSSWGALMLQLCLLVAGILSLTDLIGYLFWYKKAKRTAAEENRFPEPNGRPEHRVFCVPLILLGFLFYIADHVEQGLGLPAALASVGAVVLLTIAAVLLFLNLIRLLKKRRVAAGVNRVVSFLSIAICAILLIPLLGFVITLFTDSANRRAKENAVAYDYKGHTHYAYQDELPLTVSDLMETEYTEYSRRCYTSESILLSYLEGYEHPRYNALTEPDLEYSIVKVKAPFLYDLCFDTMINNLARDYSWPDPAEPGWAKALLTDAVPWGANKTYQLSLGNEVQNRYLLCYEDYIVEIVFDWQVTEEQMGKVAETIERLANK